MSYERSAWFDPGVDDGVSGQQSDDGGAPGDSVEVLTHGSLRLAKRVHADGRIDSYDDAKFFKRQARQVRNLAEFHAWLRDELQGDPHTAVIRGRWRGPDQFETDHDDGARAGSVRKALHYFEDQPLDLVCIDVDKYAPCASDPLDADGIHEYILMCLPPEFQGAAYCWQMSNSAGFKPGLRAHIWFWLAEALTSAQLKAWAVGRWPNVDERPVDAALFHPVQWHYTAAPVLDQGVIDPVPVRCGFVPGGEVHLDISDSARATVAAPMTTLDKPRDLGDMSDAYVPELFDRGLVRQVFPGKGYGVICCNQGAHSGDSGPSETMYFPKGVGGRNEPGVKCQHEHCEHINATVYLRDVGIVNVADDFEVLPHPTAEQEAADAIVRARNAEKWARAAERKAAAELREALNGGDRDEFDRQRREHQQRENQEIGEGEHKVPVAEGLTLDAAINRFVFLSDGSRVADVFAPHYDLAYPDWAATYAASMEKVPQPTKQLANGKAKNLPDKEVPVTVLWKASVHRKTVVCRTFKAGGGLVLNDPEGRRALNTWRPYDRSHVVTDADRRAVQLFVDHIRMLFGTDADRFLDWLAHIEQYPGVLPHIAWLHIARSVGLGRNWMASVLTRVWAGSVAANVNLPELMSSQYNGMLSRKVLAYVDEIREGARDTQWQHSQKLKSTITAETRLINPKFGRQSVEFNATRWLLFSNFESALPMETGDRRFEVVLTEASPKPSDYYTTLYGALEDRGFIAGVAEFFGRRDIGWFNPGAHARFTDAKQVVTRASITPAEEWCQMALDHWPCDVIRSGHLQQLLAGNAGDGLNAAQRRTVEQYKFKALGRLVKVDGTPVRLTVLRNFDKWKNADTNAVRDELAKAAIGLESAREYLGSLAADANEVA